MIQGGTMTALDIGNTMFVEYSFAKLENGNCGVNLASLPRSKLSGMATNFMCTQQLRQLRPVTKTHTPGASHSLKDTLVVALFPSISVMSTAFAASSAPAP